MRYLTAAALLALLVALAGCGSSDLPAPTYKPPTLEQMQATAGRFHDKESNKTVSGDQMPLQFVDMDGKTVDLTSFRGRSNVVLAVVKGVPKAYGGAFCPGCLAQVNALTANYDEFKKRDAEILMVFPGPADKDKVAQFLAQGMVDGAGDHPKLPFQLLRDTDLKAVTALGISGDLAKPSTYILDKKGDAVFAFVGEGTADRPSVQSLLARLDKLNAKK